jgi:hypothetical protein
LQRYGLQRYGLQHYGLKGSRFRGFGVNRPLTRKELNLDSVENSLALSIRGEWPRLDLVNPPTASEALALRQRADFYARRFNPQTVAFWLHEHASLSLKIACLL